ncbi:MAG TPA: hypothetical protein VGG27_06765 [Magnetospirillaceae bacterium]|jgi:hypothetical protein
MATKKTGKPRGRPPTGEISGKDAQFNTRITRSTLDGLKAAAIEQNRSVSQVAEILLRKGLASLHSPADSLNMDAQTSALMTLFGLLVTEIEEETGALCREDRFTMEAVAHAVRLALLNPSLSPAGEPKVPERLIALTEGLAGQSAWQTPEGLATAVAHRLMFRLMRASTIEKVLVQTGRTLPPQQGQLLKLRAALALAPPANEPVPSSREIVERTPKEIEESKQQRARARAGIEKRIAATAAKTNLDGDDK